MIWSILSFLPIPVFVWYAYQNFRFLAHLRLANRREHILVETLEAVSEALMDKRTTRDDMVDILAIHGIHLLDEMHNQRLNKRKIFGIPKPEDQWKNFEPKELVFSKKEEDTSDKT